MERAPVTTAPTVEVTARCLAGTAYVAVRATNTDEQTAAIVLSTPFGDRTYAAVAPGGNAYQSFSSRAAEVDAGAVSITATARGREPVTVQAPYEAKRCG